MNGPVTGDILVSRGYCIHTKEAKLKVEAFREWYEGLPVELKAEVDAMREEIGSRAIKNLGDHGVDEILASLFLKLIISEADNG